MKKLIVTILDITLMLFCLIGVIIWVSVITILHVFGCISELVIKKPQVNEALNEFNPN